LLKREKRWAEIFPKKTFETALAEYKSAGGKDWVKNLFAISAAYRSSMKGKINGYIQKCEVDSSLEIVLFSAKQFECLANTPYEDRISHWDATGNLVRPTDDSDILQFIDYKRILNHTVLVRNGSLIGQECDKFQLGK
jgi:hypothetical protein